MAQPVTLSKSKETPVLTEPAQEGLGRMGRTRRRQQIEGCQDTSDKGDRSSKKREGYPWWRYPDILRRAADHFGSSIPRMITLDQPWHRREREERDIDPVGSRSQWIDAVGGL